VIAMRRFVRSRCPETGDRDAAFCAIAMGRYAQVPSRSTAK